MERFRQKQIQPDELAQLGSGDAANYFHEWNMKYITTKMRVPAVVKPQTDDAAAAPVAVAFGKVLGCLDIFPRISQMP